MPSAALLAYRRTGTYRRAAARSLRGFALRVLWLIALAIALLFAARWWGHSS